MLDQASATPVENVTRLVGRCYGRPWALVDRARVQDPEEVEDRALSLEGEALAAWLLDPNAR